MDIYKRISPVCWYARIFGLCPFYVRRGCKVSWFSLSRIWAFILFPSFICYLSTLKKCPIFEFTFLIIPMYVSNFVSIRLPKLIEKFSTCDRFEGEGLGWLILASSTVVIQIPLYAFGLLKGDFVAFFWELVITSTVGINITLYLFFAFEIQKNIILFHRKMKQLTGIRSLDSELLENYRVYFCNILSCLNHFQKHYEPIVVLIFSLFGSKLLINVCLLMWRDNLVDWAQLSAMAFFLPLILMASHFTNNIFLSVNDIAEQLIRSSTHKNDDWTRKQVVHFVKMIHDFSTDKYVIINSVFISSFIAFLTTYLIAVVQLLPEIETVINMYFIDCIC